MNSIYLDIGNSSLTLAEEKESGWVTLSKSGLNRSDDLISFIEDNHKGSRLVISSVRADVARYFRAIAGVSVHILNRSDIPEKMLNYHTPDTLGMDRFLTCFGAFKISGKAAIVIDAGSACTIDFITGEGVFQGGVIMPGLGMMKEAIATKLPELPLPDEELPVNWPGKSTAESIQWGLYGGFLQSLKGFLGKYLQAAPGAAIFITGGDAMFIAQHLDSAFDAEVREHLLFEGMREVHILRK